MVNDATFETYRNDGFERRKINSTSMRDTAPCAALMQTDEAFILLSPYARVAGLAPQQAQNTLLVGIGLRKHRSRRLFQYLGSCEVGCL